MESVERSRGKDSKQAWSDSNVMPLFSFKGFEKFLLYEINAVKLSAMLLVLTKTLKYMITSPPLSN